MKKLSLGEKIATFKSPKEERDLLKNRINGIYEKTSKKDGKLIYTILNQNETQKCNNLKELIENLHPVKAGFLSNLLKIENPLLKNVTKIEVNKKPEVLISALKNATKKPVTFSQSI